MSGSDRSYCPGCDALTIHVRRPLKRIFGDDRAFEFLRCDHMLLLRYTLTPNNSPLLSSSSEMQVRDRLNARTVGLAGGLLEGAPIHFATEIARVVTDGGEVQVLPIVTRGPTENVNDLLYLKGTDAAIINNDPLEEYKSQVPQIQQPVTYILNLFPSELHIRQGRLDRAGTARQSGHL
jgi:hypothetical protein